MSEDEGTESNPLVRYLMIGVIIALFIVAIFIYGAYYSCHKSNGTLTKGYRCVGVDIVKACDIGGVPYLEKVPLYKEILSNGSLSDSYYVGGIPNGTN